jgi:hypothetical protein
MHKSAKERRIRASSTICGAAGGQNHHTSNDHDDTDRSIVVIQISVLTYISIYPKVRKTPRTRNALKHTVLK